MTIPEGVTSIGWNTFDSCTSFSALELQGNSLPTIGSNAFSHCSSLVKLFVPAAWTGADSVTLDGILTAFTTGAASLVKIAGLTSVLDQTLSTPAGGSGNGSTTQSAIIWPTIDVENAVTQVSLGSIESAPDSTAELYSNADFNANRNQAITLSEGETLAYIKVTTSDSGITRYHKVTVNRAADSSGSGGGGGGGSGGGGAASTLVTKIDTGGTVTGTNVDNLVKEGKSLTVDGKSGETLVFDTEALKTINAQTKDTVKVEIKDVSSDYIHVHPGRLVVSLTVTAGDQRITNFGNGTATISLPYDLKEGEKAEDVTVWYLAEDGTMTEVPCTYNPATKLATFQVNHFSLYLVGTADISLWVNPFSDVAETRWYYDAVRYVSANGLMNGTADTAFNPNGKTSRGMIVTILWRMENQPSSEKEMTFTDVKSGKYYWDAVAWGSEKGIVSGYSENRFGPEDNITREQLAVILHNYAISKGIGTESTADLAGFVDSTTIHDWALDAMMWANGEGLINGVGNSKLSPLGSAERCQVAAILQRFILNSAE